MSTEQNTNKEELQKPIDHFANHAMALLLALSYRGVNGNSLDSCAFACPYKHKSILNAWEIASQPFQSTEYAKMYTVSNGSKKVLIINRGCPGYAFLEKYIQDRCNNLSDTPEILLVKSIRSTYTEKICQGAEEQIEDKQTMIRSMNEAIQANNQLRMQVASQVYKRDIYP